MAKVLNLNVAALALIADNTQVRVREKEIGGVNVLQIRPSARVLATNLPAGETMRTLSFKKEAGKVRGAVLNMKDLGGEAGQAFELVPAKYGWVSLAPVAEVAKGAAFGRVAVK